MDSTTKPAAIIFDMDGVLVDSEPLWRRAEIASFAPVGIALTDEMCRRTAGLRVDEVVQYWFSRHGTDPARAKEVEAAIWVRVLDLVRGEGALLPGVRESLEHVTSCGIPLGLASTSRMVLIDTVVDTFKLRDYFSVLHSAEFETHGKPHPAVYLTTAARLGVRPNECLAIEDSLNGLVAAKAAKMKCYVVPDPEHAKDVRFALADVRLVSLHELKQHV